MEEYKINMFINILATCYTRALNKAKVSIPVDDRLTQSFSNYDLAIAYLKTKNEEILFEYKKDKIKNNKLSDITISKIESLESYVQNNINPTEYDVGMAIMTCEDVLEEVLRKIFGLELLKTFNKKIN